MEIFKNYADNLPVYFGFRRLYDPFNFFDGARLFRLVFRFLLEQKVIDKFERTLLVQRLLAILCFSKHRVL